MRSRFGSTVIGGVLLVACVSIGAAKEEEAGGPVLLARFDEGVSRLRTLFLYSPEELRAVYVWLGDSWVPAEKARDASSEEPYYAYRVSSRFNPNDSREVAVNSWAMSGEVTYRHKLQIHSGGGSYRVATKSRSVRSRHQHLADQQLPRREGTIPNAPAGVSVAPESRALINAVRETGAQSVHGHLDPELVQMAMRYAQSMARQQRQDGHAGWNQRFQYLISQGAAGASEITAESWSHLGPSLETHAHSCVSSWLQSPGHRADMMRYHGRYGYAMARGDNGVYYAVGVFAN